MVHSIHSLNKILLNFPLEFETVDKFKDLIFDEKIDKDDFQFKLINNTINNLDKESKNGYTYSPEIKIFSLIMEDYIGSRNYDALRGNRGETDPNAALIVSSSETNRKCVPLLQNNLFINEQLENNLLIYLKKIYSTEEKKKLYCQLVALILCVEKCRKV